ncbi:MAG: M48 family metallopeptidase [Acidiferrobacterales bacterium]|nr:M48 family metallopeptidase [Acidiferrobacterales bacterium]
MSIPDGGIHIEFENGDHRDDMAIDTIQGSHDVNFVGGGYFRSNEKLPTEFVQRFQTSLERKISWLEKFSLSRLAVLILLLISAVVAYRLALNSLESIAVRVFPVEWEQKVGQRTYEDIRFLAFTDSRLSTEYQTRIRENTRQLANAAALGNLPELYFHRSELIGPNALAFPGGPIVVTDELVELLSDSEEVMAVIAHELAHIKQRHSLQSIVDVIGASFLAILLFGADEGVIEEMATIAASVLTLESRRNHEQEADILAVQYLSAAGRDPSKLIDVFRKMSAYFCAGSSGGSDTGCDPDRLSWLSTHPSDADRIAYLQEAIQNQ